MNHKQKCKPYYICSIALEYILSGDTKISYTRLPLIQIQTFFTKNTHFIIAGDDGSVHLSKKKHMTPMILNRGNNFQNF